MEAAFGALLVAQMVDMRMALARIGKRLDTHESSPSHVSPIIRVALAVGAGSMFFLIANH